MIKIGIGVDIVDNSRIKKLINDKAFISRIFSTEEIVMYLSQNMTLCPGDIICVGTSLVLGPMEKGSKVTIYIEGIGKLSNTYG